MSTSGSSRLWWLLLAVACQFVWGIYPAAVRYLQTQGTSPLSSLQLSLLINLLACPALLLGTTLPTWLHSKCSSSSAHEVSAEAAAAAAAARAVAGGGATQAASPTPIHGQDKQAAWRRAALGDSALGEALLPPEGEEEVEEWLESQLGRQLHGVEAGWGSAYSSSHSDPPSKQQAHTASHSKPAHKHPYAASASSEFEASGGEQQQQQQPQHKVGSRPGDHLLPTPGPLKAALAPPSGATGDAPTGGSQAQAAASWRQVCCVLLGTTFFLTLLFLSQVFSLLFTTAYLSQMVFLLAPVMVALLARALFKQPLPPGLWTALALMLLGCGMVIGSKAQAAAGQHPSPANAAAAAFASDAAFASLPALKPTHPGGKLQTETWQSSHIPATALLDGEPTAAASALPSSLWGPPRSGQDAWLCTTLLGPPGASWLRKLCGPESGDGGTLGSSGEGAPSTPSSSEGAISTLGSSSNSELGMLSSSAAGGGGGLGPRDAIGIGLALLGATSLAGFMLVVQRCGRVVSNQQVLWANFLAQSALCACLLARFEPFALSRLLSLAPQELGAVAALATGVNWGANMAQQMCIKRLGAPQAAAFLPVRLLGSLAASYPLLSEGLSGPCQWGGCAILLLAVWWYLLQQRKAAEHSVADAAFQADTAGPAQGTRVGHPAVTEPYMLINAEAQAEGMVGA